MTKGDYMIIASSGNTITVQRSGSAVASVVSFGITDAQDAYKGELQSISDILISSNDAFFVEKLTNSSNTSYVHEVELSGQAQTGQVWSMSLGQGDDKRDIEYRIENSAGFNGVADQWIKNAEKDIYYAMSFNKPRLTNVAEAFYDLITTDSELSQIYEVHRHGRILEIQRKDKADLVIDVSPLSLPLDALSTTRTEEVTLAATLSVGEVYTLLLKDSGGTVLKTYTKTLDGNDSHSSLAAAALDEFDDHGSFSGSVAGAALTITRTSNVDFSVGENATPLSGSNGTITSSVVGYELVHQIKFTDNDWNSPQKVYVKAINDDFIDGTDALVFAPLEERVNSIQGPITVNGGFGNT